MNVGWKGCVNKNSVVLFGDVWFFLVSRSSWYKGFLVFCKFMENVLWTRGDLTGEGDHKDSSLDELDINHV